MFCELFCCPNPFRGRGSDSVEFLVIMLEALAFIPRAIYTGHNDRSPVNPPHLRSSLQSSLTYQTYGQAGPHKSLS